MLLEASLIADGQERLCKEVCHVILGQLENIHALRLRYFSFRNII